MVQMDNAGSDKAYFEQSFMVMELTSPFAKGLAYKNCKITPTMDFSREACMQIVAALFMTIQNHHGYDYASQLFSAFGGRTSAPEERSKQGGPSEKDLEILRRYAAMEKPNITQLAKDMHKTKRHIQRVINSGRDKYGYMRFSPRGKG